MFEDEITIFNKKYNSKLKDFVYIRTYLTGVNVDLKKAVNVIKSGLENADSGTIIIPEDVDAENKEFTKPIKYKKSVGTKSFITQEVDKLLVNQSDDIEVMYLSSESNTWTLNSGDIVVLGIVDYDINGENTIAHLRENYDDVYEITSVDTKLHGGLPHWEIGVK